MTAFENINPRARCDRCGRPAPHFRNVDGPSGIITCDGCVALRASPASPADRKGQVPGKDQ
jgi:hypothetical protein